MVDPQASRFWQAAVQSELVDVQGLTACLEAIPAEKRVPDQLDRRLARQAVTSGLITLWQAQQLLSGRSTGFKINRYTLLDLIGQGGMGRVYLAKDTRLNRRVAVKILSPERVNNPRAIARFQREARVGAQLQHENLVRIYDEGESNGKCYIVMEYIEGKNIGTLIAENGPLASGFAARLARQVALGLQHAQVKGLIHRDVNPYNILVTQDGTAKLTDLGLAIDLADQAAVTRDGATVGTFDYVSPEQARHSHSVDTRSDIYSLGCTLYHMLAGRVPFPSPSLPEKLFGHQAVEPEPIASINPNVPEGLAAVVARMMRKVPEERYADPLELAIALEPFVDVLGSASGSHDDLTTGSGSGIAKPPLSADTKISRHIEPAAPAPAPPVAAAPLPETTSGSVPTFDLGIDFGGGSRSAPAHTPAAESFNLGIALDAPPAAPKPPAPAPAPAPVAAKAPKPVAPAPEAPAPKPDFAFNLGGEKPAEAAFNLGISLDAPPAAPKSAPPAASKPAPPTPAPTPVTAKAPKPVPEAPAPQPDFAFNLGGEKPAEAAFNLGISLDAPPAEAKPAAPSKPAASAKAAAPPKPAPAAPPSTPAPAAVPALDEGALPPGFNFDFGAEKEKPAGDALNLGLAINLGGEPASPPSKPASKKAAPAPAPAPTPAPPVAKASPAPKPVPAPAAPLDLAALNLGGGPPDGAHAPVDLGLALNLDEPSAATPAPVKSRPAPPPKPAKSAPPPEPEEAPFPTDFAASLSGEKPSESPLNFGLGLDLGAAPVSPPSKPAPKKPAPAPAPAPADAPATPAPVKKRGAKPPWKDKRVLIGAGAGSALCVALALALVFGAFGGKSDEAKKPTTKTKGKVKPASSSIAVKPPREKPVKTTKSAAPRPSKSAAFEASVPEGEGFAVQAGDKTYSLEPDLKNAMQRAIGSHGRVVLNDKSPRKMTDSNATINISGGMLTIAAAPGTQPVLEVEVKGGTPWLSTRTDTPLALIGLTIVVHYSAPGPDPAPIILAGGKVTVDRCTFRVVGSVPGSRAVTAEGGGLAATGCFFEGFDKALDVSAFAGTTIVVKQCMMVRPKPDAQPIGWGLRVRNLPGGAGKTARRLIMEHCTVKGKGLLDLVEFSSESPFDANVTDCALMGDTVIAWESKGDTPLAPESLHWTGVGNVYDLHGKGWIVKKPEGTPDLDGAPTDLESWTKRFTDRDAVAKPLAFATEASALSDQTQPSDFAITDSQAGAKPNLVGPKTKP